MSKPIPISQDHSKRPSAGALRLLSALAQEGAYGWLTDHPRPGTLAVSGQRNAVSVQIASAPQSVGRELLALDYVHWHNPVHERARMLIKPEGRSALARLTAPAQIDPFQAQHSALERKEMQVQGQAQSVMINVQESPLAWLASRKSRTGQALIDPVCVQAGERLRRDLTAASLLPRTTSNWTALVKADGGQRGLTYSDQVIAARQRVDRALKAVGSDSADLLLDVCGFLKGLETIESERGWPARSAKVVLALALHQLARHYGYEPMPDPDRMTHKIRHWGAADYRPSISVMQTSEQATHEL
ncbi:MAG: ATPase [Alphaproteobacteria bacterium]|nr:ATPase [Alphaproteobacteria bacterium]